jgi:hypothetical protein
MSIGHPNRSKRTARGTLVLVAALRSLLSQPRALIGSVRRCQGTDALSFVKQPLLQPMPSCLPPLLAPLEDQELAIRVHLDCWR